MTVSLVQNFFKQSVTTPWTVGTGNFYVSQKPNVTSGFLVVSPNSESLREIVAFSAVGTDGGGDFVTVSARGLGGTTEQAHGAGERVFMNITAQHIEQIKQAIEDINNAGALNASTTVKGVARLTASPAVVLGNPTITIATPGVVTLAAHGLTENDEIQFTTDGNLPTGIIPSGKYYVIGTGLTTDEFQFSETFGGAAVATSGSQSGTHTLTRTTPRAMSENDPRIPSNDLADALEGSQGVPNDENKFVTEDQASATTIDQSQLTQNAGVEFGEADSTLRKNKIAQSFVAGKTKINKVRLYKTADTGTFTGTVTVSLQADTAGNPSGSALSTTTITNANWLEIAVGAFDFSIPEYALLVAGTTYWIVIEASTADNTNHPNLGMNSAAGYADGVLKYNNVTDNWTLSVGNDLYFATIVGAKNQVVATNSEGVIPLDVSRNGLIFADFVPSPFTAASTALIDYLNIITSGAFTENTGIKITANIAHTTGNQADEYQVYRLLLNGTVVASFTLAQSTLQDGDIALGGKIEFIVLNDGSMSVQKYIANGLTVVNSLTATSFSSGGGAAYNAIRGTAAVNTTGTVRIQVQGQNSQPDANLNHQCLDIVVEKFG